jgi:hypothetical protein
MHAATTDLDFVAGILVAIIGTVSALTLFGMAILMAIGAMSSSRSLVTSWPAAQEAAFTPFEQRGSMTNSRAWTISLAGAIGIFVFVVGIYFGVTPERKDVAKDMNMSNLTKKHAPAAAAPKPDSEAPAAEAPKADKPADKPAEAAPKE